MRSVLRRFRDSSTTFRPFIVEAKFGCDSDSVADRRERLSDKLFVCIGTVKFGCIAALLRPFRIRLPTSQAFLSLRKETLRECAFGEEALLAPKATSTSGASGLLFHTVTVCPAFKRLAAIREPNSSETAKSNFCSYLLLPPRVAHHVVLLCGSFRLHHSTTTLPNARRWPGNGRRRPTDRGRSCCPGRDVPPTVRAQRHNPAAGAYCQP